MIEAIILVWIVSRNLFTQTWAFEHWSFSWSMVKKSRWIDLQDRRKLNILMLWAFAYIKVVLHIADVQTDEYQLKVFFFTPQKLSNLDKIDELGLAIKVWVLIFELQNLFSVRTLRKLNAIILLILFDFLLTHFDELVSRREQRYVFQADIHDFNLYCIIFLDLSWVGPICFTVADTIFLLHDTPLSVERILYLSWAIGSIISHHLSKVWFKRFLDWLRHIYFDAANFEITG